jgi:hypothetical protein
METEVVERESRPQGLALCVKTACFTANSAGSGLVFLRISGFGDNPVKYTDPDGRINVLKILGGGALVVGSAGITFGTVVEDFGTLGMGVADDVPSFLAAGALFAAGRSLIESGLNDNQNNVGQGLANRAQAAAPSPAPKEPNNDDEKQERDRPASEQDANRFAKQIEKDLGKDARRTFHDMKEHGAPDRSMKQLMEDASAVYEEYGKLNNMPKWMEP